MYFGSTTIFINGAKKIIIMFWTLLFYLFLIIVFIVFLKLGNFRINGRRVITWPMRFTIAIVFPLIVVLVALFSSIFLLFILALLLIALLVFLLMYFLGKAEYFQKGSRKSKRKVQKNENIILVKTTKEEKNTPKKSKK